MAAIPKGVTTFSELVEWLVREKHDGVWYGMAKALSVSAGLPYQWRDKTVKAPSPGTIMRMCEVYGLDYRAVWDLIIPPQTAPARRLAKAARRGAAVLMLTLGLPALGVAGPPHPLSEGTPPDRVPLIGYSRRRRWSENLFRYNLTPRRAYAI
jgi:hypothetical protein